MSDRLRRMVELARGHIERGEFNAAGAYYRMIMKDTSPPKSGIERIAHGEAARWYGARALAEGKHGTAADWYRQAINADPRAVEYRLEYCVRVLIPMGMFRDARIEAERATKIEPDNPMTWRTLAGLEHQQGHVGAAIEGYDRQLQLLPDDPNARLDRATVALDTADYDTVRAMCEPVLDTDRRADALHCLAMAAYREARHEQAIELYEQAIAAGCFDPNLARWNQSLALHSIGRYREGWAAHEARGQQKTDGAMALIMKRFTLPMWQGEPAPARIHVHQEMGHGDTLAMARYIPMLQERGYEVQVEVSDVMVELFRRSFPKANVMAKAVDYPGSLGIPVFDYHVPMLSLPALFQTDIDTVPWSGAYLKPNPELVAKYRKLVPNGAVGLCWSSGIRNDGVWISEYGRRKSMPFNALMPVIKTGVPLVSLQVGPERRECRSPVLELLPEKPTWDDTAALIECLDLVITVDTAVAHLAGALGKPVWLMMHGEGSWHFMTKRLDSPWYPTARLFRQTDTHKWGPVVQDIRQMLEGLTLSQSG
jgi:NAD(P)-dependent dehydrogenase (short-subunit alcohol dehydrogenase family)